MAGKRGVGGRKDGKLLKWLKRSVMEKNGEDQLWKRIEKVSCRLEPKKSVVEKISTS